MADKPIVFKRFVVTRGGWGRSKKSEWRAVVLSIWESDFEYRAAYDRREHWLKRHNGDIGDAVEQAMKDMWKR